MFSAARVSAATGFATLRAAPQASIAPEPRATRIIPASQAGNAPDAPMTSAAGTRATTTQGALRDDGRGHRRPPPRVLHAAGVAFAAEPGRVPFPSATTRRTPEQAVEVVGRPGSVEAMTRPARSTISAGSLGALAEVAEHDEQVVLAGVDDAAGEAGDPSLPVPHRDQLVDVLPGHPGDEGRHHRAAGLDGGPDRRLVREGRDGARPAVGLLRDDPSGGVEEEGSSRELEAHPRIPERRPLGRGVPILEVDVGGGGGPLQDLEPLVELLLHLPRHRSRRPLPRGRPVARRAATPGRRTPRPASPPGSPR